MGGDSLEQFRAATPCVLPEVARRYNKAEANTRRLDAHRKSGHKGKAIERDLTRAVEHAAAVRALWRRMQDALLEGDKAAGRNEDPMETMHVAYLEALQALLGELEKEGEP